MLLNATFNLSVPKSYKQLIKAKVVKAVNKADLALKAAIIWTVAKS